MDERFSGLNEGFSRLKSKQTVAAFLISSLLPVVPLPVVEVVDLGDIQIPLKRIADCSLDPPSGVVVSCSGFPLTTGENDWWEVPGQPVIFAHNTTYLKPEDKPARDRLNPGAELMYHAGQCVDFGNLGPFKIGKPVKKLRSEAWLIDIFPRVIVSAEKAIKIPPGQPVVDKVMVYEAPLTPCKHLDTSLTPRGDVIFYVVKTGDNLSKIATRYGVTLKQLADANKIEINVNGGSIIWPGENLIIPTPTP